MPASPIRRLMPYAEAAAKRGIKIYHLNIGQPDIGTPAEFWEGIRSKQLKVLEYCHSAGNASLREKMAAYYRTIGIEVSSDELMVTTAGSEALRFAFLSCLNPGDEVIVPEPLYANYLGFACEAGINIVPITTRIEDGFRLPNTETFEGKITARTRGILICNPSNPTGTVYTADQLLELRDLALKHDLFIFADEVYREFNYSDEKLLSVLEIEGLEQHAIMLDSVSKRFSLCGARIGFIVSRNRDVMSCALKFAQARLSPPTLEQFGIEAALDNTPASYFSSVREEYRSRKDLLRRTLNSMNGVLCPEINGAFYATVRLPVDDADKFCQWLLEDFNCNNETVMLAPASGFYATEGLGRDEVRIAYVLNEGALTESMNILYQALAAYPGRTAEQPSIFAMA